MVKAPNFYAIFKQRLERLTASLVLASLVGGGVLSVAPAQVLAATGAPSLIHHQGRLFDTSGNLLGGSSGTDYCFKFSFYDDATVGGPDTKLWPTGAPSTMTVEVKNGVFGVNIGDTGAGGDLLDFDFESTDEAYLNVEVAALVGATCAPGDGVEVFDNLDPRQRVVSAGYAINANTLGGFSPAQSASGSDIPVLTADNLILGGSDPEISATGTNLLTLQSGSTGNIEFFSSMNTLDAAGNLILDGMLTTTDLTLGTIAIGDTGSSNTTSGASLIGIFDEFTNSNATTVQAVIKDLDTVITGLASGSSKWTDSGTFTFLTSVTDDLVVGAATVGAASLFFDESAGLLTLGTDSVLGGALTLYSSGGATPDVTLVADSSGNLDLTAVELTLTGNQNVSGTLTATTVDLNGGAIDGTAIGASVASSGAFTTLASTGVTTLGNNSATVAVNSSDWDITATGTVTGIDFDANGSGNSITNIDNADLSNDTVDFDKIVDAATLDAATSITGAAGRSFTVARALTDAASENGIIFNLTASDSTSGTTNQFGLYLDNLASTEGLDASLVIDNSDTDDSVGAAIKIVNAGGGFTNLIDNAGVLLSSSEVNLLDGGIAISELTDSGTFTAASVDINGGAIDGTTIGATVASTGAFTTLSSTGATTLGNNSSTVAIDSTTWDISAAGVVTLAATTGQTTAIDITDTDYTNAFSIGDNNIIGTTAALDFTNFDVSTGGNITVAAGVGLDTNAAGALAIGNTNATSISECNSAACDTYTLGTNADADSITIGESANDTISIAGSSLSLVIGGTTVSGSEITVLDAGIALSELTDSGTLTAGTVDINGGAIDGTAIGASVASTGAFTALSSTGVTTIGNNSATVAVNSSDWDISVTGAITGVDFDANGSGNSISNIESADILDATLTGDDLASSVAGAGLVLTAGSPDTIDVVSANGGIVVNADNIALTVAPSADALSSTTSAGSGIEILSTGFALLQGCANNEILKWNETTDVWACAADTTGGGTGTLDDAYNNGGTITVDAYNVLFNLADSTNDYNFTIDNTTGGAIATALSVTTTGGSSSFTTALDLSDADIVTALAIGANDITVGGATLSSTEVALLDSGIALSELTDSGTLTAGTVDINGGAIDGTAIGGSVASSGSFTTLASTGVTTIGNNSATVAVNSSSWDISSAGVASGFTGLTSTGNITLTGAQILGASPFVFEGATDDDITTTFVITDPTSSNKTITFQNGSGTVAFLTDTLSSTLTDNVADSLDIQEGTNNYININTTNASENIAFGNATTNPSFSFLGTGNITTAGDAAVNGGDLTSSSATFNLLATASTTINAFDAATTTNINDAAVTSTIDIGGVTASGTNTINIATNGTAADGIAIGNTNAATTVAITGGDDWSITGAGVLSMTASAAATTAIVITDTDYTNAVSIGDNNILGTTAAIDFTNFDVSTGGNITVAAGVGLDTNAAGALAIGNTNATSVSLCNSAACDAITIGSNADADTITIGDAASDTTTLNGTTVAIDSGSWDVSSAGVASGLTGLTTTGNVTVSGAQILGGSPLVFEGATDNDITTTFVITDPTITNKTITFQNGSGTVAFLTDTLSSTLTDNVADSLDIQEGTNNYININTTNASENISFGNATTNPSFSFLGSGNITAAGDLALNGGDLTSSSATFNLLATASTTINAFDAATTTNINDAAVTSTIDIGGVTNSGTNTINVATNGTAADGITIGNSNASTTVAITGGDDWSITGAGVLSMTASAAATTAILITDTDYTNAMSIGDNNILGTTSAIDFTNFDVSTGGNITVAAGVGLDTNGAGALAIGNTNATSVSICNSAACDTISIGNNSDADTITIGDSTDTAVSITDDNWSFTTAGLLTQTATLTNTSSIQDVNLTLGNDADADTVSGINIDVTSAATGDADIVYGLNVGDLTTVSAVVTESAIRIGANWENAIDLNGTLLTSAEVAILDGGVTLGEITSTITDNVTDAYDLQEGTNNYININTTNAAENISFGNATTNPSFSFLGAGLTTFSDGIATTGDAAINGGDITSSSATFNLLATASTTINAFDAATTTNINDAAVTSTIDIGGVTASGTNTINIATNGTAADTITIGNTNASTTLALTGGDDWSMTGAGVLTMSASAAATTAIVITDTDYTNALSIGDNNIIGTTSAIDFTNFDVSTGGNITVAAGVGLDTNAAGALAIGNTNATSISECNSAACDTYTLGTNADADTITIGDASDSTSLNSANWSIATTGNITTAGDAAVNGGDLTSSSATFNLLATASTTINAFDAATTTNINDAAVTSTIDIGGVTNSGTNTINIATNGTAADGITIGNTNASTTLALTGGDDWSMTGAGVLTMSASAAATTAIVITDTDYTNAVSIGDNNILGTTAAIDFTNFDVSTTGDITTAGGDVIGANSAAIDLGEATTGAITFTAGTTGDYVFSLDSDSNATFNSTITGTSAIDLISSTITNQTTSGTQRGLAFTNANDAANAVTESLIFLDNAETTASTVTDAILITSSGVNDGITDAIDASAANITNAINIGANAIAGTNFSVTGAGVATATGVTSSGTITFSGLTNCNDLSTNGSGVLACSDGPDTAFFSDTTPAAWAGDNNTTELWDDATRPNITVTSTSSTVLVSVHVEGNTSNTNNDLNLAAQIAYDTGGADPTCGTDPTLGSPMNSGFATATAEVWGDLNGTFVHDPGVAANSSAVYTLCSSTNSSGTTITDSATQIDFTLVELGADLAENYYTNDPSLKPGEVVAIDPSLSSGVRKSTGAYDENVIGVISTLPGLVMNDASHFSADGKVQVGDNGQGKLVPIALAGRIPVYVSNENGEVKTGDYLTASSIPGVAMKATKSGLIIGQALNDANAIDGDVSLVAVFVKNAYYNGSNLSEQLTAGLDAASDLATSSQFLQQLMANQADVEASLSMSDIATDRLTAGLEIITPKLVAGQVQTDTLAAATGSDLSIALTPDGHFKIGSTVTIDAAGNATFAGTLTAASVAAENVTGLNTFADEITVKLDASKTQMLSITDELKSGLSALAGRTLALENLTATQSQTLASLSDRLTALESRSSSSSPLTLDTLGSVGDSIRVFAHLDLIGRPYFNNDTAGFAVIKAGDQSARVTFSEPYLTSPIVNASVTFDAVNDDPATATDESLAASEASAAYLSGDLRFVVADENVQGFSLKLSKPVNYDVRLSWTALAVNNPRTFWSSTSTPEPIVLPVVEPEVVVPAPEVIVEPEPEVAGESDEVAPETVPEPEPEIAPVVTEVVPEVVPPVEPPPEEIVINE